jgi:hypothetical protein
MICEVTRLSEEYEDVLAAYVTCGLLELMQRKPEGIEILVHLALRSGSCNFSSHTFVIMFVARQERAGPLFSSDIPYPQKRQQTHSWETEFPANSRVEEVATP